MFLVPEENDATICMCEKIAYEELQDDQAFE